MANINDLCMNCMSDMGPNHICPKCGYNDETDFQVEGALPYRTLLDERYLTGRAILSSGEGITYIGLDITSGTPIELREFYPPNICMRGTNMMKVVPTSGNEILLEENMVSFISNARRLAHMREISSISHIYDIFEENNTTYTVSEWHESISLRYFVERSGGSLHWNAARQIFMPVLSALSAIHENGCGHYGISPSTLNILPDGKMRISGFEIQAVRRAKSALMPDLVEGCAAIEQYSQGTQLNEATDIYGFAATLFYALTGTLPQDAVKRSYDSRLLIPTAILKNIPPHVVTALANALQVDNEKRTQSFERLRAELSAAPTVTASIEETQSIKRIVSAHPQIDSLGSRSEKKTQNNAKKMPDFFWFLIPCVATIAVLGIIVLIWNSASGKSGKEETSSSSEIVSSEVSNFESSEISEIDENAVPIPDLVGKKYDDIVAEANPNYEILIGETQFSDDYDEGYIVSQSPSFENGKNMTKGDVIVVNVSKGSSEVALPSISGISLSDASVKLSDLGFIPTKVDVYSDSIGKGLVVGYKDYYTGDKVSYGSQVIIEVSLGPKS